MRLQDFAFEVAKTTQRVGVYLRTGILRHHKSVLVIQVGQAESSFWQFVEELFLGFEVVLHRFMIIQMVAGQISENTAGNFRPLMRFWAMEWELTSMKAYLQPESAISPSRRFRVIGSGVVCSVGTGRSSM